MLYAIIINNLIVKSDIKITNMKMMFHIDDFKCTLCANWFCPPFNLPYLLPCTHSICTSCLQKSSNSDHIICPEDLEACPIQSININLTTKKALERLMKQHKNYSENTQLQCIKSLSIGFDQLLLGKQKHLRNLEGLIDQIFTSEIDRLKHIHEKIKIQINRPYRIVEDWKQIVAAHLNNIRKNHHCSSPDARSNSMLQLNHYIEEGRKIKMELNEFFQLQFDIFADKVMRNPRVCFQKDFTINLQTLEHKLKRNDNQPISKLILKTEKQVGDREQKIVFASHSRSQAYESKKSGTFSENRKLVNMPGLENPSYKNVDFNTTSISRAQEPDCGLETKRGTNQSKISQIKQIQINNNQNISFDKYFTLESQKNAQYNTKVMKKDNEYLLKKNAIGSPFNIKNKEHKFVNQGIKNSVNHQSKSSLYDQSIGKNDQFSLTQFQLETLHCDSQEKRRQNKRLKQATPTRENYKLPAEREASPASLCNEDEKLKNLAHMLDNISAHTSNNNSVRNSLRKDKRNHEKKMSIINQASLDNSLLMSPNMIREQYTEQGQSRHGFLEDQLLNQQLLINDDRGNGWELGSTNFLKEWKIKNQAQVEQPLEVKQNTYFYNCEKQKVTYMRKMQIHRVNEALRLTLIKDNFIQLINESLHDVDMMLYLEQFDWKHSNIQIVKFVKTSLSDEQLNILLNYLVKSGVKALVLSGNNLTDICLDAFLNFTSVNSTLKNVYLPKNYINILKSKSKINLLKQKGLNIYI